MPETLQIKTPNKEMTGDAKLDTSIKDVCTPTVEYDLSTFQVDLILQNNTRNKSITLLGCFPSISKTDKAIVILEKLAFRENEVLAGKQEGEAGEIAQNPQEDNSANEVEKKDSLDNSKEDIKSISSSEGSSASYFCPDLKVHKEFINNIYGNYRLTPPADLNSIYQSITDLINYNSLS